MDLLISEIINIISSSIVTWVNHLVRLIDNSLYFNRKSFSIIEYRVISLLFYKYIFLHFQ